MQAANWLAARLNGPARLTFQLVVPQGNGDSDDGDSSIQRCAKENKVGKENEGHSTWLTNRAATTSDENQSTDGKSTTSSPKDKAGPREHILRRGNLPIIRQANLLFMHAMDDRTYHLAPESSSYIQAIYKNVRNYSKPIEVQFPAKYFNPSVPIAILSFLPYFQFSCDTNEVHEGLAMFMLQFFLNNPASMVLHGSTQEKCSAARLSRVRKKCLVTMYCEVVKDLVQTYGTDA